LTQQLIASDQFLKVRHFHHFESCWFGKLLPFSHLLRNDYRRSQYLVRKYKNMLNGYLRRKQKTFVSSVAEMFGISLKI
jgi:hypothetical protein